VNGRALIVRDRTLRERMEVAGKVPALALVVTVEQAFVHCGKCMIRSRLWERESWPDLTALPTHGRCLVDQAKLPDAAAEVDAAVQQGYRTTLY
jgi:hypothetical protein